MTWTYELDFMVDQHDWVRYVDGNGVHNTQYVEGAGFTGFSGSSGDAIVARSPIMVTTLTKIELKLSATLPTTHGPYTYASHNVFAQRIGNILNNPQMGWNTIYDSTGYAVNGQIMLSLDRTSDGAKSIITEYIQAIRLTGTGDSPFDPAHQLGQCDLAFSSK